MNALASSLLLFISKPFMMLRFSLNNKLELLQRIPFLKQLTIIGRIVC